MRFLIKTINIKNKETAELKGYVESVAAKAIELLSDRIHQGETIMLPFTLRANGLPGLPQRPWALTGENNFLVNSPNIFSLALIRESPDVLRNNLRIRRTFFEGILMALSEKTGRRPSRAEQVMSSALDDAESRLALGDSAFKIFLLISLYAHKDREKEIESVRQNLATRFRTMGFFPQHLTFIVERALLHFQPGGMLFPGIHEPTLMQDEAVRLLPSPTRQIFPAEGSVWLGTSIRDSRDVYFSPEKGLDPKEPQPPHATTLLLGEMGAGKTSLMRSILIQRMLQGRRVISLDPEGENNRLCEALGGHVLPAAIPDDKARCLLHPLASDSAGEMLFAVRFLFASLNNGKPISAIANAAIHDLIQEYWRNHGPTPLSLSYLVTNLKDKKEKEIRSVCALLHPFAAGGLWEGFFDRPSPILQYDMFEQKEGEPTGSWWNFDLSGLQDANKSIMHAVLSWFLYRVVSVSKAPVDIFLDEGWRLLRSPTFAALMDELGRRARKRGMGIILATHLPEDLVSNPSSLSLASNAFVGRLGPGQSEAFLKSLGIPEQPAVEHAEKITRLPPHVFYVVPSGGRGSLFSVRIKLPPGWLRAWQKHGAAR